MTTSDSPGPAADAASAGASGRPQADHADHAKTLVQRIADLRAWLFLLALILGFVIGWRTLDRRIRKKYGGLRIY